ncbi:MAG: 2-pyrone-4,6-dicarboxylate hydrolase, partial [Alphaproteobacteria bacterium]|nr:2-pyrone-4,6-dicarboxylate hydrolase [Alphaproteobacteria bacterium]
MLALDLPKIDGHCHVLDPERFPYPAENAYHPRGQEIGTARYFAQVMATYGVRHALLIGPNSGYGTDNRCLLDAIERGEGRFKGMAVVPATCSTRELKDFQAKGVIGIAFNPSLHGLDYYRDIEGLIGRLAALGMWAQFQVQDDQLAALMPLLRRVPVRVMIDHCGRPRLADGPDTQGGRALLELAAGERSVIKLSGFAKFSFEGYPFAD